MIGTGVVIIQLPVVHPRQELLSGDSEQQARLSVEKVVCLLNGQFIKTRLGMGFAMGYCHLYTQIK